MATVDFIIPQTCPFCGQSSQNPSQDRRRYESLAQRFWDKVFSSPDGHWYWMGYRKRGGHGAYGGKGKGEYGELEIAGRRHYRAHRFAWMLTYGPIPLGQHVLHRCDMRPCVRPDHLFLGTHLENIADAVAKGRMGGPTWNGVENGRAKLTEYDVQMIRAAKYSRGLCRVLARKYGVSDGLISHIRTRRIWRHIP